jgi:lycopene beta-cyclase
VEYTLFSINLLKPEAYFQAAEAYLRDQLGVNTYRVVEEEVGIIPMTSQPVRRRLGNRILAIGTRGGRVKPSTGYAFHRIQRDSQAIVSSLLRYGHPFEVASNPRRFLFYDALLLDVLARSDPKIREIFTDMFSRNPIDRVFRFVDETTSLLEDGLILATLPPVPFLYAFVRKVFGMYK